MHGQANDIKKKILEDIMNMADGQILIKIKKSKEGIGIDPDRDMGRMLESSEEEKNESKTDELDKDKRIKELEEQLRRLRMS